MLTALKNRIRPLFLGVRRDRSTGHLFYEVDGVRLYIRFPEECLRAAHRRFHFEEIYFGRYLPSGGSCVVDVGAGIGTEIVPLARRSPGLRYFAVEIQPWVYECLSLTLAQLPEGYRAFGQAIGEAPAVRLQPSRVGIDASTLEGGTVEVPGIGWADFVRLHGIDAVDLLKINIEGGEGDLLDHVDLSRVERVLVQVHDFRADRGEGEHFRTRDRVTARLAGAGFAIEPMRQDWLFASRSG